MTWFITGAGRGLGRAFATAALDRGDIVAATARDVSALDDLRVRFPDRLYPFALDVTQHAAAAAVVDRATAIMGSLDVVVNNAGYGHFGTIEELSEQEIRDQFETNVFGALWVSQAAVPIMRSQGYGHIIQISSLGGIGAFANLGAYNASKWALEAFSESLALEVAPFGIAVTIVEPGGYETDWSSASSRHSIPLPEYEPIREAAAARRGGQAAGKPDAAATALLAVADTEEPPLRVIFGAQAVEIASAIYERRLAEWAKWKQLSVSA
ncbi:SDR family NAD(P)-dependent oxidoreductase [Leifsonia sp. 2TAF2]|uniref:SDR family NAD(P)-dependent oxidoreductase n=1 Tax=Leifsonia sp. 2TAF2 TaxID=3233009 RepID=UPI003F975B55